MAEENSAAAPARARLSGRVWFVLLCAAIVVAFLVIVLPGVFDVRHERRTREITKPITRLVLHSKGMTKVEIKPSYDGHVHLVRTSSISRDSRLIEHVRVSGKTLTIHSTCTGSRFGVLRSCDLRYYLRVPRKIALALHLHFGTADLHGLRGRLTLTLDAGRLDGFGCNKRADVSLRYGSIDYRDECAPEDFRARMRAGDIVLTVPAGRYAVQAERNAQRPFANIIEDPASPNLIDADVTWAGSIAIEGVHK